MVTGTKAFMLRAVCAKAAKMCQEEGEDITDLVSWGQETLYSRAGVGRSCQELGSVNTSQLD